LYPAPSRVLLTTELREATEAADKRMAALRDRYFFDHPDLAGGDMDTFEFYRTVALTEADTEGTMAPRLAEFDQQAARQQRLISLLQYFSPAMLAQQSLSAAAGTDAVALLAWRRQVLAHHVQWRQFFTDRVTARRRLTAADYTQLPRFVYTLESSSTVLRRVALPLTALLVLSLIATFVALRRLRNYPIV
jgi:ABC-2 type transport system permease protein